MLNPTSIVLKSTISFDLHAPQILGTRCENAKVLALLDADSARSLIDPIAMHANIYPFLPPGVPDDFDGYSYLKLRLASGETTAIGLPWIKDDTLVVASTRSMRFTVANVTPDGHNLIIQALSANGFRAVDVVLID